jgi:hypothetical protein
MQGVIVANLQNEVFEDIVSRLTYGASPSAKKERSEVGLVNRFNAIPLYIYSYALMMVGVIYFVVAVH